MHQCSLIRGDTHVTCETNRAGGNELEGKKRFTGRIVEWMQFKTRRTCAGGDWKHMHSADALEKQVTYGE